MLTPKRKWWAVRLIPAAWMVLSSAFFLAAGNYWAALVGATAAACLVLSAGTMRYMYRIGYFVGAQHASVATVDAAYKSRNGLDWATRVVDALADNPEPWDDAAEELAAGRHRLQGNT